MYVLYIQISVGHEG